MYQCSKKERQTYPIRPHHGMCLAFFIGNGYSTGFTAHMQEMLELFTKGADVCLTVKTDEICSACPNNSQGICEAAEKVKRYDNAVLADPVPLAIAADFRSFSRFNDFFLYCFGKFRECKFLTFF